VDDLLLEKASHRLENAGIVLRSSSRARRAADMVLALAFLVARAAGTVLRAVDRLVETVDLRLRQGREIPGP